MRVLSARKQNQEPFAGRPQKTTIASDNPSYRRLASTAGIGWRSNFGLSLAFCVRGHDRKPIYQLLNLQRGFAKKLIELPNSAAK
jgi:hypothetical protein